MKALSFEDKDYLLWVLLHQTTDGIVLGRDKELRRYGISTIEAAVLFSVQSIGDKATPAEISRWLLRKPHSVSGLLKRMERKGLIKKAKDLNRKNLVRVSLTEKGKHAYCHSTERKFIHKVMSALTEEERQQLKSYLERLRTTTIKHIGIKYQPHFP